MPFGEELVEDGAGEGSPGILWGLAVWLNTNEGVRVDYFSLREVLHDERHYVHDAILSCRSEFPTGLGFHIANCHTDFFRG